LKAFIAMPLANQTKANVDTNYGKVIAIVQTYLGKDIEVISNYDEKSMPDLSDKAKVIDYALGYLEQLKTVDYFVKINIGGYKETRLLTNFAQALDIPTIYINNADLLNFSEKEV